ncbi:hypothetical protein [Paraburkholderia sp. BL10I2N1]|uniref:hypothetical protein n=1 Tax=Paraburkholderia sp. BL10I2N1 TaxID=1938796 RepID=UPI00105C67EB|nr:hypothetical protein [Paraburkholderia sp. BL10I2N1]TDN70414.1 hypothetical protein B0G77_3888 [Paraburkholderia sp. BL10I2N1]
MTIEQNLVSQGGIWDNTAKSIVGSLLTTGLSGAGTSSQANAAVIPLSDYVCFSTVAANAGAILPAGGGAEINVFNGGANALLVYPPVGGNVNQGTVNVAFSVAVGKNCLFQSPDGLNWFATHST